MRASRSARINGDHNDHNSVDRTIILTYMIVITDNQYGQEHAAEIYHFKQSY